MSELIDRQAVRLLESDADAYTENWNNDYEKGFCDAINKVLELPTIEAEPVKHGRWIDKPYERWKAYDVRYCSKCNWSIHKNHLRKTDLNWNFCPNCGARMDGGSI